MYAFETPIMPLMRVGATPVPVQAPPALAFDDVTKG
jgi:hypothetical protein